MTQNQLGRIAYDAYGNSRKWKTVSGAIMPDWVDTAPEIQAGWEASALAVVNAVYQQIPDAQLKKDVTSGGKKA